MTTGMNSTTPRRLAGAVIAALAAYTGSALAQAPGQVTSASGQTVVNAAGEPWQSPFESASASQQVAQAGTTSGAQKRIDAPSARRNVPASASAPRDAFEPGYVEQPDGTNWRNAAGECWRGAYWTPAMAAEPCDAVARASVPAPVAVAPQPQPAPAPQAQPEPTPLVVVPAEPRGPMIQKITLETDVLFGFDRAELRDEGKQKLDEIADGLKGAEVNEIVAIGYTDPIGNEQYNEKLSQRRADAVKEYLAQKGVSSERIQTEGRGEQNLVTGDDCRGAKGQKLISCLEPNRRVEIEVFGQREVAATEQPAAGATTGGSTSGATSGSGR